MGVGGGRAHRNHSLPSGPRRRRRGGRASNRCPRLPGWPRLRTVRAGLGKRRLAGANRSLVRATRRARGCHRRPHRAGTRLRVVHPLRDRPRAAVRRQRGRRLAGPRASRSCRRAPRLPSRRRTHCWRPPAAEDHAGRRPLSREPTGSARRLSRLTRAHDRGRSPRRLSGPRRAHSRRADTCA